jgi:mRNA interferase RelE/StbE
LAWRIEFSATAEKQLKKIDRRWQMMILDYLEDEISVLDDPRAKGKGLTGDKKSFWRYRVGDYRIICQILDKELVIVALMIGHRRKIYGDH